MTGSVEAEADRLCDKARQRVMAGHGKAPQRRTGGNPSGIGEQVRPNLL